ncbi:hypothetical protein B0J12DRAFT_724259 [Macrophomina phaseolina]|uniref:Cell wall galactomannoprotein n=1 Tax=Macrophomina phaseolina TaxID=35725 RepID=A0ABQ8GSC6_9PEZI|nr:hypothetical protein B0J12DRAFT_724259 [Macrophomina phaseolina]
MKVTRFLLPILLTPAALASPISHIKRDVNELSFAIGQIKESLYSVNGTLDAFHGNPDMAAATQLAFSSQKLLSATQSAASAANSTSPLSGADSARIAGKIAQLESSTSSVVDKVEACGADFHRLLDGRFVEVGKKMLRNQSASVAAFGDAVAVLLAPEDAERAADSLQSMKDQLWRAAHRF